MSHRATLLPSGKAFAVAPGQSVLDAAIAAGIGLPYGCRNGACLSCRARLVSGTLDFPLGQPRALSDAERAAGFTLLCRAHAASDVSLEAEEVDASGRVQVRSLPVRLTARRLLAPDVMELTLSLPADEQLHFRAGQYVDIVLRNGRRRAFSLANAPGGQRPLELHVRQVPGGSFSGYVFSDLRERTLLRLHGPLGSFYLRDIPDSRVVMVAGGTGFAPIKSMVEDLIDRGHDAPLHLYWGARARQDLYLHALVEGWVARHRWLRYTPVLSEPHPRDAWTGRTGLVHEAVLEDFEDLGASAIYMAGPPAMVAAGRRAFPERGARIGRIFHDAFDHAYQTGHDA